MRDINRIPKILKNINLFEFIKSFNIFYTDDEIKQRLKVINMEMLEDYWLKNPDLRLTQVLVNLNIIPNVPGVWYYIEETEWQK
jgi:hypothetical protein